MKLPLPVTIKNRYLPTNGQDCTALMRRGQTTAGITAAMERPAWQK